MLENRDILCHYTHWLLFSLLPSSFYCFALLLSITTSHVWYFFCLPLHFFYVNLCFCDDTLLGSVVRSYKHPYIKETLLSTIILPAFAPPPHLFCLSSSSSPYFLEHRTMWLAWPDAISCKLSESPQRTIPHS